MPCKCGHNANEHNFELKIPINTGFPCKVCDCKNYEWFLKRDSIGN
jgi:hypothetical protein